MTGDMSKQRMSDRSVKKATEERPRNSKEISETHVLLDIAAKAFLFLMYLLLNIKGIGDI